MAAKKKRGRGGRGTPRTPRTTQRRTLRPVPDPPEHDESADPDLLVDLRAALRSDDPMTLLGAVSGILEVTLHRRSNPFADDHADGGQAPTLSDMVDSFIGYPCAETTATLTVIRALVNDELMGARIARELAQRRQRVPGWLAELADARIEPAVWRTSHVLGDGDSYQLGVTMPSGRAMTALVYVDHNLGTVVKDAFVTLETLATMVEAMSSHVDDPDTTVTQVDPATTRAIIEQAIETGAMLYPPLETDSWPMCRPVVEWMVRMLPPGGTVPARPEWSQAQTAALADDFFASRFGTGLDDRDRRGLLESVLWYGTDYGPGDPLRWSGVSVEILLLDWFPRKVVADPPYLAQVPDLLRAFIAYAHDRQGISRALTTDTLAAVSRFEPEYQRLIRSDRPQGPAALLARALEARSGGVDPDLDDLDLGELDLASLLAGAMAVPPGFQPSARMIEIRLEALDAAVGGRRALERLDAAPLPDEPFVWDGIADDIHPAVQQVLDSCDRCAEELLDVEHRTAMRRFLHRAAAGDPAIFRRGASSVRLAAAVAWAICRANDTAGDYDSQMSVKQLLAWFGLKGSVSQRAEPLLRAVGVDTVQQHLGAPSLGTPDLLVAGHRADVIRQRDSLLAD